MLLLLELQRPQTKAKIENVSIANMFRSFPGLANFELLLDHCPVSWELAYSFSCLVMRAWRSQTGPPGLGVIDGDEPKMLHIGEYAFLGTYYRPSAQSSG